jgi:glutamate racemase
VRGKLANESEAIPYLGPAVANEAARIDPTLVGAYAFEPAGLSGDPAKPESWRIASVDNYVRYDVTTMVENYRRSGARKPIRYVVLGCTHFPYEATRIAQTLTRLRNYRDASGQRPYRDLIAESVDLVDPGELTAAQLYRRLFQERLLSPPPGQTRFAAESEWPLVERIYISVPSPDSPRETIAADGGFTASYKYSRTAARWHVEDARVTSLTLDLLPESSRQLLRNHCPRVWATIRK